ncbi:peptidase [Streptomyces sp. NPDC056544]|uniref:peptidase n=1 Tax=unclassified Streptomyces TaxID=2593676 RepID=UPI0036C47DEB
MIDVLPYGAVVTLRRPCQGATVSGPYGTANIWDCIGNGRFVSDAYVKTGSGGYVVTQCG